MVNQNEVKRLVKEMAYKHKLNMVQLQALFKVAGIHDLHISPMICAKCEKPTSEVNHHNVCKACETELTNAEKKFQLTQPARYEDDLVVLAE